MLTHQRHLQAIGRTQRDIIGHLRRKGAASRAELADLCGVTTAAISMMTRDLIERGILTEGSRRSGGRGAPHVDLILNPRAGYALGIHANRFSITMAMLDFGGTIVGEWQISGSYSSFSEVRSVLIEGKQELLRRHAIEPGQLIGAGIAMPTRFREGAGRLDLADEIISWAGADLETSLRQSLGCPVHVENDANAAAMGELTLGKDGSHEDFVYLYLSEGIGGGLIIGGKLYRGTLGNAGELGALRARGLSRPSFDDLAAWFLAETGGIPEGRAERTWTAYLDQHPDVLERWLERAGPETAKLAFPIAAILAPSAIYLGGTLPSMVRNRLALWLNFAESNPHQGGRVLQPNIIVPQNAAKDAVALGAAAMILHDLPLTGQM
ncbi:ROK family transcriptional regulator [Rhizobium oryzicola]|uniref:ROK family transcriptional regulator n=1 Tax=Rhizobium oryzicola TaxID=1232668 RepID=A0ABT8SXD5_9HYPH|nr:ROK family transcriptional regulator [Rhizobium oryzicola]MDO1583124.1 ROK family transcriptional regulator [Rhizobium oryzicola]